MGVLHIAIPAPGGLHTRRDPRPSPTKPSRNISRSGPESQKVAPPPSSGTLQTPSRPLEGKLQRTPEQEAEQEAVSKLVRQCIAGDPQAWQQLVVSQHRRIYAICYRFTGSATDAEDLTQDVFLKLYKNLSSFDTLKGSFQTWITTLARNLLVDHFRRTRLDRASESLDATLGDDENGPPWPTAWPTPGPPRSTTSPASSSRSKSRLRLSNYRPSSAKRLSFVTWKTWIIKKSHRFSAFPREPSKAASAAVVGNLQGCLQRIEGQVI